MPHIFRTLLQISTLSLSLVACGTLPSAGPTEREILAGTTAVEGGTKNIVYVTEQIAKATQDTAGSGLPAAFMNAGATNFDTINPGDTLQITVWENVDNGLLGSLGQRQTSLPPVTVQQNGQIYVPYVGNIPASGRTTGALRNEITEALADQTPDPQVNVMREAGDGATITIVGTAGAQGIQVLNQANSTLLSAIASSGGISGDPAATRVRLTRGGQSGVVQMQQLFDNPALDVKLRPGDRITIEADRRYYTVLGAGGAQTLVPFQRDAVTAINAIAETGGLSRSAADPTGIFVFRNEEPEIARRLFPAQNITGPLEMIYLVDLTSENGIFTARNFEIRDQDTIYVTEAPLARWSKTLGLVTGAANATLGLQNTVGNIAN